MQLMLTGINILLLLAVWKFMLRKSILDAHRDSLFDMRDDLRQSFLDKGWSLDSPLYKTLRDLINGYLRFTESYSLSQIAFLETNVKKSKELQETLKVRFEKKFKTQNAEEAEFIHQFRRDALNIMMSYMVVGSGPLLILAIVMIPVFATIGICRIISKGLVAGGSIVCGKAVEFNGTFIALIRVAVAAVASKFLYEEFVEEYSFRQVQSAA